MAIKSAVDTVDRFIEAKAKDLGDDQKLQKYLLEWWDYVKVKAAVLKILCSDSELGNTLFRSINARGKNLGAVDLIKNDIFNLAGDDDSTVESWEKAVDPFQTTDGPDAEDFLRHQWIAREHNVRLNQLHNTISSSVNSHGAAEIYLNGLVDDSILYSTITQSDHPAWAASLKDHLKDNSLQWTLRVIIHDLQHSQIRPLLMVCFDLLKDDPDELKKFLLKFVGWSIRGSITRTWTRIAMESAVATACQSLKNVKSTSTAEIYGLIEETIPNDDQFSAALENTVFTNKTAKLLLGGIENFRRPREIDDQDVPYWQDVSPLWVEHILPRKPAQGSWPAVFDSEGNQTSDSKFKARTLGNLTLLSGKRNVIASNHEFAVKKQTYEKSGLLIVNELATVDDWSLPEIANRQAAINKLACEAWPV